MPRKRESKSIVCLRNSAFIPNKHTLSQPNPVYVEQYLCCCFLSFSFWKNLSKREEGSNWVTWWIHPPPTPTPEWVSPWACQSWACQCRPVLFLPFVQHVCLCGWTCGGGKDWHKGSYIWGMKDSSSFYVSNWIGTLEIAYAWKIWETDSYTEE